LGLDFHGEKSWAPHKLALDLEAYYAENDGEETKNNWFAELNYYYQISKRLSFNYLIGYRDDKFSGYDYQFYTGPGVGYLAYQDSKQKLFLEGNLLYEIDKFENGDDDSYLAGRAGLLYEYKFNENLKFVEDASIRARLDDFGTYFVYSKTSLYSKMTDRLSLGVSYKVNYQSEPPADKKSTDTTFMVSLVVDW